MSNNNSIILKESELPKEKLAQFQTIQRFFGFNEENKLITIDQAQILKHQADKYNLDILNNEITLLYGKPYITYHGIKKILADKNIDYMVSFRNINLTKDFVETYCDVFITPAGYSNRMEYIVYMKKNGFNTDEAIKLATNTGYAKMYLSDLNRKIQKYAILMAKKQAFKDALNFANLSSHNVGEMPIDFEEELIVVENETTNDKSSNSNTTQKQTIKEEYDPNKAYNTIKNLLIQDADTSIGLSGLLLEDNKDFNDYLFKQMKLNELSKYKVEKIIDILKNDKNGKKTELMAKIEGFFIDYTQTKAFEEANNDDDIPFDEPSEAEKDFVMSK